MKHAKRLAMELLQKAAIPTSLINLARVEAILKNSKPLTIKKIKARK